jgi:nuclear pore complex protein Nup188
MCWQNEQWHSGWKVVLDVLSEYMTRRRMYAGTANLFLDVTFGRTGPWQIRSFDALRLEGVGMEIDDGGDR